MRGLAEHDKISFDHETILSKAAVGAAEQARLERPAIGDAWVLPSSKAPEQP